MDMPPSACTSVGSNRGGATTDTDICRWWPFDGESVRQQGIFAVNLVGDVQKRPIPADLFRAGPISQPS
jgi:hypothetical protein